MHDSGAPAEESHEEPPTGSRRGGGFLRGLRELAIVVVAALVISAIVRGFLIQAFWVPSGSMEQTLERGDRILVWKPGGPPDRGDVVVFRDPSDWLNDQPPPGGLRGLFVKLGTMVGFAQDSYGDDLVKRVIGVGGDTVACCSPQGQIIRNGSPIDEPYLYPNEGTDQIEFSVEVPEGRLFVMGDHRSDSADSRFHLDEDDGTVPVENVVGVAKVIMWPIGRWATLPDYQDVTMQQSLAPEDVSPAPSDAALPGNSIPAASHATSEPAVP